MENDPKLWLPYFPFKTKESNKYTHGHAVIVGAAKMTGATRLAAEACARIGAGLVTVVAPQGTEEIYRRTLAPHVIVEDRANGLETHLKDERRNAVLIGPGAGTDHAAIRADIEAARGKRLVLDADALNARPDLPPSCIVTPHEGEFARLFPDITGGTKIDRAGKAAATFDGIVVYKGSDTVIASADSAVVNTNAPPSLATAGTGDVLAGMITGLLAQGMPEFHAACAAVWIHAEAARTFGPGLVASDAAAGIPAVLGRLYERTE